MRSLLFALLCLLLPLGAYAQAPAPSPSATPSENVLLSVPKKLMEGGTTVLVQIALSIVAGAFFIERLVNLRRDRIAPHRLAVQADALWDDDKFAEILKLCVEVGGCLTGEHGVGVEKRDLMRVQFTPEELALQMRIKSIFDPQWLLNPAKVFPLDGREAAVG